jgi:alpha-mannosidase
MACLGVGGSRAQTAYFADGYHGGIYGHYPPTFTAYMVDSLRANPGWKLNLEIEPETWDFVQTNTPEAYQAFKEFADDPSTHGRLEFVNPDYAQSYLWNISGESILQQFDLGTRKIREHFPNAVFSTYSSEEPCFASALPGILKSFGFKYAVLKNPNTCWGGYTRAFAGELVNWIGPDGTMIPTVPRYAMEQLRPGSTWETIANANSINFVEAAFAAGISDPMGMCYQDAGWRFGPWLQHVGDYYQPTESILWRDYFANVAHSKNAENWRLSQEDIHVSLVWGAQVLQRIAQEVRRAENRVVMAEKMATIAGVWQNSPWPGANLDEAWRTLLLSQHHDCWIVPYNRRGNDTWADKVARWTGDTRARADNILDASMAALTPAQAGSGDYFIRVFNTLGEARTESVMVPRPADWQGGAVEVTDPHGAKTPIQWLVTDHGPTKEFILRATVPPLGFATYRLRAGRTQVPGTPEVMAETNHLVTLETDLYRMQLDSAHGGTIRSLVAKKLGGRELVDTADARRFNELRGYFFERGQFCSTADGPAKIELLESGPLRMRARISGRIASNSVITALTLTEGEPRIDFSVRIAWQGSSGIGSEFQQAGGFDAKQDHKAFYEEQRKLLVSFPLNLPHQQVFKDAPFDVCESQLTNTFFENWSDIKNDVILNWVDVVDKSLDVGAALLTDHTTSYGHGRHDPLTLTLQYSGIGLWGRTYSLDGATEVRYAILPHAGDWQKSNLWAKSKAWNEPLLARVFRSTSDTLGAEKSLLNIAGGAWEIPTVRWSGTNVIVRLFNPSTRESQKNIHYGGPITRVALVQLNGETIKSLPLGKNPDGTADFRVVLPAFGIGTLRITP